MLLWIKAVLLTLWHGIVQMAVLFVIAVVTISAMFALIWALVEFGTPAVVALVIVAAAYFIWLFVSCVRDNHERLQTKAWLEESARGGEKL